jgi:hypothetical protein
VTYSGHQLPPCSRRRFVSSLVKRISLNGTAYFAKPNDEVIGDSITPGDEYQEVTSQHAIRALFPAFDAHTSSFGRRMSCRSAGIASNVVGR